MDFLNRLQFVYRMVTNIAQLFIAYCAQYTTLGYSVQLKACIQDPKKFGNPVESFTAIETLTFL
jgi:hypothetical protein